MKLVVGLGNPGEKYALTRHNIGFMVADCLALKKGITFNSKKKGLFGTGRIDSEEVILLKPQTFMNLSGESVQAVYSYYNIRLEDLIVVHDDIDLDFARIRIKQGGGHGGHNGIRSISAYLGSNQFTRLRIGVGRSSRGDDVSGHVLSPFNREEVSELSDLIEKAVDAVEAIINEGALKAMNQFN